MINDNRQSLENSDMTETEPFVITDTGIKPKRKISIGYKILIIIGFLIIVGIFTLCSILFIKIYNKSKAKDKFYVEQEVLKYLEERYNEEFVVMYNRGSGPAYNYVQLYGYPKGYSDEKHKFEIQGYYNKWGKLEYYDSYVMVKLTDDYEAYIDPIIGEYFEEYKFYIEFDSEWLTSNLPSDSKLEDLWELRANEDYPLPTIYIYIYNADKDRNYLENMVKEFSVNNIRCSGRIVYYYDYERYTTLTRSWNDNVTTSDFDNILTYLIYDDNNYKFYQ